MFESHRNSRGDSGNSKEMRESLLKSGRAMGLVSLGLDVDHVALRHFERGAETVRVCRVLK